MNPFYILLFVILIGQINSLTCGGNCPDNSCTTCVCGSVKNVMPIDNFCYSSREWDSTCCRCIVARTSGGNAYYNKNVKKAEYGDIGMLAIYG